MHVPASAQVPGTETGFTANFRKILNWTRVRDRQRQKEKNGIVMNSSTLSVCGVAEGAEGRTKRDRNRRNRSSQYATYAFLER